MKIITSYTYSAYVTTPGAGCQSLTAYSSALVVYPNPTVVISGDPIICATPATFTLIANVNDEYPAAGLTYQWRLANADILLATSSTYTGTSYAASDNPYVFTVMVSNTNGCQRESSPFYLYINSNPTIVVTSTENTICNGGEVILTANLGDANATSLIYQWLAGLTPIIGATHPTLTVSPTSSTRYSVVVSQTTSGCSAIGSDSVTVNSDPVISSVSLSEDVICAGGEITITAHSTTIGGTYTWYRNGILIEGVSDSTFTESPLTVDGDVTTYVYSAYMTLPASGCQSAVATSSSVTVNPNPVVAITGDPLLCDNGSLLLAANVVPSTPVTGTYSYQWYEDNVGVGLDNDTLTLVKSTRDNPYIYTVVVNSSNGCSVTSAAYPVYVNENPSVVVTPSESVICAGGEVTFSTYIGHAENIHYQWYNAGGIIAGATLPTYTTTLASTATYTVTITQDGTTCSATGSAAVTVNSDPVISSVSLSEDVICAGGEITITAHSTTIGGTYTWYRNGILIEGVSDSTFTESPLTVDGDVTTYVYSAYMTLPASGCQSAVATSSSVTVNPNPVVAITGDPLLCDNGSLLLAANVVPSTPVTGTYSYQWYEDNVGVGLDNDTLTLVKSTRDNPYIYTVVVNSSNGCSVTSAAYPVYVNENPSVVVTPSESVICAGGEVTFSTYIGHAENIHYQWYNAGGIIAGATLPTYTTTLASTATYTVTITQDGTTCSATGSAAVTVNSDPVISSVSLSEDVICAGGEITITAHSTTIGGTYTWYRNGILIEGVSDSTFTESPLTVDGDVTTYVYSAYMTLPASGCQSAVATSSSVTVNPNPVVAITGDPLLCDNGSLLLAANVVPSTPVTGTYSYQWYEDNVGVGLDNDTLTLVKSTRDNPYIYTVVVNSSNGCSVTSAAYPVYVNENPSVVVTPSESVICAGGEVTFSTYIGHAENIHYQWYNAGGIIAGATLPTYTTTLASTATYTVTITQDGTTCSATGSAAVTVNSDPVISSVSLSEDVICAGGEITITAHSTTIGGTYTWYRNGILIEGVSDSTFTESPLTVDGDVTTYVYSAYMTLPASGCQSAVATSSSVTVNPNPVVAITGDPLLCDNGSLLLAANVVPSTPVTGTYSYQWYEDNVGVGLDNDTLTLVKSTRDNPYIYTVVVNSSNGCSVTSAAYPVYVNENPSVVVTPSESVICAGGEVTFSTYIGHAENIHYQWYNAGGIIAGATLPTYTTTLASTATYTVTITQDGTTCSATGSAAVTVNSDPVISSVSLSEDVICAGGEITITAHSTTIGGTYTWYRNGILIEGVSDSTFTESPLTVDGDVTTYVYSAYMTLPASGCQSAVATSSSVTVNPNPVVAITGDPLLCDNGSLLLAANVVPSTPVTGTYSYQWYEDNVGVGLDNDTLTLVKSTRDNPYIYTVVVNSSNGCSVTSAAYPVYVNENPSVVVTPSESVICAGGEVTFSTYIGHAENIHYQWYNAGGIIAGATLPTYTTTLASTATYTVTITQDGTTCSATGSAAVTVNSDPVISSVSLSEDVICAGGEITITAHSTTIGGTYTWYRNGILIEGVSDSTFTESPLTVDGDVTTYVYSAYMTLPASGCQSAVATSSSVTVNPNPVVAITGDPLLCDNGSLLLAANVVPSTPVTGTYSYQWYEDNVGVGLDNDTLTLVKSTRDNPYIYTVVVNSSNGCSVTSAAYPVYVNENPSVVVTPSESVICAGGEVTFSTYIGHAENIHYQWYNAGGIIAGATLPTYTTTLASTATYTVTITQDGTACTATGSAVVTVKPIPVISLVLESGDASICQGGEVVLRDTNFQYYTDGIYQWYVNDVLVPGATQEYFSHLPVAFDDDMTSYYYNVSVTLPNSGCQSILDAPNSFYMVDVYPNPTVVIDGDNVVCNGSDLILTANITGGVVDSVSYIWYNYNEIVGTDDTLRLDNIASSTHQPNGVYSITVAINQGTLGCSSVSDPFEVTVADSLDVVIDASVQQICAGGEVAFTAHLNDWNQSDVTYKWFNDGIEIPGATSLTYIDTFMTDANITFTATRTSSACVATSNSIFIDVILGPTVVVDPTLVTLCEGGEMTLSATASGSGTYSWYKNGVLIPGATLNVLTESPLTVAGDSTIYTYDVVFTPDMSGCSVAYDTAVVTVYPNVTVAITGDPIICHDNTVTLVADVNDNYSLGTLHYEWRLANATIAGTDNDTLVQTVPASDNPYIYTVVVSNTTNNCTAVSNPYYVYVNEHPQVVVTVSDSIICEDGEITLTGHLGDYNTPNLVYQWYINGVLIPDATQIIYTTQVESDATFTLVVTQTTSGCVAEGDSPFINVLDNFSGEVVALNPMTNSNMLCDGGEVQVTAYIRISDGEGYTYYIDSTLSYVWFRNGFLMPEVTGPQFMESLMTVDSDTSHYVYSVYVDLPGCSDHVWYSQTVTVRRNPVVVIAGDHVICEGSDVSLVAWVDGTYNLSSTASYIWYEHGQRRPNAFGNSFVYSEPFEVRTDPYVFTVEFINPNGCSAISEPFDVLINALPVVNITATEDSVCDGGQVTLRANLDNYNAELITFQWYENAVNDANIIPGATQIEYTPVIDETMTYYVQVIQLNSGCSAIDSYTITKFADPTIASVTLSVDTICDGGQVTVTATLDEAGVPGSDYIYTWYRNGVLISGVTGASFTESPLAVDGDVTYYVYNVTVAQSAAGCASILNPATAATLMVNPNPTVVVAGDPIVCRDDDNNINLTANVYPVPAVEGTYTYQWYEDNVEIPGATLPNYITHKAYSENPYNFSVRVANPYGCSVASDVFSVLVNEHPVVNITSTETTICETGEITLTAHLDDWNAGDIIYQWFKNGVAIPGATSLTYTTTLNDTSVFTFEAIQTTSECHATSDSLWINVNPLPVITDITVIDNLDTICEGRQIVLMANISGGVTGGEIYTWYRNGVEIAGAVHRVYTESPLTVDNEVTTYVYNVVVRQTAAGCASIYDPSDRVTITVNPNPTVTIAGDPIVCRDVDNNIVLSANVFPVPAVQGSYTYQWFEDNVAISGETASTFDTHKPYQEYPYNFSVRVYNEYGCSVESEVFSVIVNEHPVVTITATENHICEGGEITLTAHLNDWNAGDILYQWYKDGDSIPGATSLTYTTTLTTSAAFTFTALQTTSECLANSNSLAITVENLPVISEIEVQDQLDTICEGRQVVMHAVVAGGVAGGEIFTWYRNGVEISGANQATYSESPLTVDNETTIYAYNVVVRQTAAGCASILDPNDVVIITVNPNPTVTIAGDPIVCRDVDNNIVLSANVFPVPAVQGSYTYQWFEDNVAIVGETASIFDMHKPYREYPYNFSVRVSNEYGCSVESEVFSVIVNEHPVVNITSTETTICEGGEITLTAHLDDWNSGDIMYQWSKDGIEIPGATSLTYTTTLTDTSILHLMLSKQPQNAKQPVHH